MFRVVVNTGLLCVWVISFFYQVCEAQTNDLVWYLQAPKGKMTSAAINALDLVNTRSRETIVVAIVDNGVAVSHPSLEGKLLPGWDMVSPERNPKKNRSSDVTPDSPDAVCPITNRSGQSLDQFHGTEIASIIAGNGQLGVVGINPRVRILPVKSVGVCKASRQDLIDAIAWAGGIPVANVPLNPHPAKVINISMAGKEKICDVQLQSMIDRLIAKGVVIVSAAGNTFGKAATEPAVCNGVIGVGAINPDQTNTFYSAVDNRIVLLAPGGGKDFPGTTPALVNKMRVATYNVKAVKQLNKQIQVLVAVGQDIGIGTSYASPLVAGAIAGILLKNKNWTTQDVLQKIKDTQIAKQGSHSRFLNFSELNR